MAVMGLHTVNEGVQLVYDIGGEGAPIVLLHDFMECRSSWKDLGYVDRLLNSGRRVVAADLRGHGDSGKPHERDAYTLERQVSDVIAVLDAAGIEHADLIGYAMGARVALGVVALCPDRVRSVVAGGTHPYAESLQPCRRRLQAGFDVHEPMVRSLAARRAHEVNPGDANDVEALAASVADDRPDISDLISGSGVPILLYMGEKDPRLPLASAFADQYPAALVTLPRLDHYETLAACAAAMPHILRFLDRPERQCSDPCGRRPAAAGVAERRTVV
jgi:pimeloyl-ACP methyl ester carboxylesterase